MSTSRFAVLPLVVAALALGGCQGAADAGGAGAGSATGSAPASAPVGSAAPSTAPPTTATATPAAAALQITDTGLGDLVAGEKVPDGTTIVSWTDDVCGGGAGAFVPTGSNPADPQSWAFSLTTVDPDATSSTDRSADDPIALIVVRDPSITTAVGIHAGSTVDELTAAYSDFAAVYEPGERGASQLFVLENDTAQTVFEVYPADAPTDGLEGVTPGTVAWILIQPASAKAFGIASSDGGGPCPA